MKRVMLLLLCLALFGGAWAEEADVDEPVWMSANLMDDYYFHATEKCPLATGEEAWQARTSAERVKKSPCPVCWEDETDYSELDGVEGDPLECFERGGTLVIRISDYAIRARMNGASMPAQVPTDLLYENDRQDDDIARLVHGAAYADWANAAVSGASAQLTAYIPDLDAENTDALLMSRRHIGAAWVLVVRPNADERAALKRGGYYHLPMALYEADLRVSTYEAGSTLRQGDGSKRWTGTVSLLPQPSAGEEVYRRTEDDGADYPIYVIRDGGVNTAVIRNNYYRESDLTERFRYCGQTTKLTGYVDGKQVVFVCALTDGEVRALQDTLGFILEAPFSDEAGERAGERAGDAPVAQATQSDGTVAEMDQPEYPVGTGFVSFTLTRPAGGIAWYTNHIPLQKLEGDWWRELGAIECYADGDPARAHEGTFCDHVTLVAPLDKIGALEEGLYRMRVREEYGETEPCHTCLEFRVTSGAPAPTMPEKREFGHEFLMVFDHTPPNADAKTYNSCADTTRVQEGGIRTRLLAGDTVFELLGVDESWGWGISSVYNLFAYPEGHPEQARQLLANFDHAEVTLYDAGDSLLLCDDQGNLWRCDYNGGNLTQLYESKHAFVCDFLPVGNGAYIVRRTGVWHMSFDDCEPKQVYAPTDAVLNDRSGGGYAVYAEGQLIIADNGIVALDALHPNADGTLPANWLTNEYPDDNGANGFGYIVLGGRLYYWSEQKKAMLSMKLDGTDIQEVSKDRYWFYGATPEGIVLALWGSESGMFGDERTDAALFFPPDPEHPAFDPDHCEKRPIEPESFDFVLGNVLFHRDAAGNETREALTTAFGE